MKRAGRSHGQHCSRNSAEGTGPLMSSLICNKKSFPYFHGNRTMNPAVLQQECFATYFRQMVIELSALMKQRFAKLNNESNWTFVSKNMSSNWEFFINTGILQENNMFHKPSSTLQQACQSRVEPNEDSTHVEGGHNDFLLFHRQTRQLPLLPHA
jgi:hypothetical protein